MITLQVNRRTEEIAEKPTEGKWFKVNPMAINQQRFKRKRSDYQQEKTRQLILAAFEEMKKNPKYEKPFMTMMPEKTWESKTVGELKELASKLGDHNADWVEQALEWAQRIENGEGWRAVCNKPNTTKWYRLVVWKDGLCKLVGSSGNNCYGHPASYVFYRNRTDSYILYHAVPLVVAYE